MHLTKMEGLGNDYLYVYGEVENPEELSRRLSDRHFGIGSDGLVMITPSEVADAKMRIFNADGSEAMMCGNGIRCVGKFLYDKGYVNRTEMWIQTLSGVKELRLSLADGKVDSVRVSMGKVEVSDLLEIGVGSGCIACTPVSVGNPHAVIFVDDIAQVPLETLGPEIERHKSFPGGVNVEFAQVIGANHIRMRVWERGSGVTLACGTGACATVAAAVAQGHCDAGSRVFVELDGGMLAITIDESWHVLMEGPARTICECEVEL
ncbi:MAG: diaminopimelate epimerase [bacterium]|nr:diaminopimelate epimerase [bacterium]